MDSESQQSDRVKELEEIFGKDISASAVAKSVVE